MSAPVDGPQALPSYADRLQSLGARRAFFAHVCEAHARQFAGVPIEGWPWRPIAMCSGCGQNTGSWCDSCELRQLGFATVFGQVMAGTPLCGQCETDERCRVCSGEEEPLIQATAPDVPVVVVTQGEAPPEEVVPPAAWTVGWRVRIREGVGLVGGREGCVVDGGEAGLVRVFEHEETFQCYQLLPSSLVVTGRTIVGRVTPLDILRWDHLHHVPRQPETEWLRRDPLTWTEAQRERATVSTGTCVLESARRRALIGGLDQEGAMTVARHVLHSHHDTPVELALSRPFEPYQGVVLRTTFAGWRARRGWKRSWARIRGFLATSHLLGYLRQQATLGESQRFAQSQPNRPARAHADAMLTNAHSVTVRWLDEHPMFRVSASMLTNPHEYYFGFADLRVPTGVDLSTLSLTEVHDMGGGLTWAGFSNLEEADAQEQIVQLFEAALQEWHFPSEYVEARVVDVRDDFMAGRLKKRLLALACGTTPDPASAEFSHSVLWFGFQPPAPAPPSAGGPSTVAD